MQKILFDCYSKDLCYSKFQDNWTKNNRCMGMCAITSLIVNDYFGGHIAKIYVDGVSHYFNLIENKIIDLTAKQFKHEIDYKNYQIIDRLKILNDNTNKRYNILKERFMESLSKRRINLF